MNLNIVAFFVGTEKESLLYFIDNSMSVAITCFDLIEKAKSIYGNSSHNRYTRSFENKEERAKEWEKLFVSKLLESQKEGYLFHAYSNFDDMFRDDIFMGSYKYENESRLLHLMKHYFGKVPVPYKGNKYLVNYYDENFSDEEDKRLYDEAVKTINNNRALAERYKERAEYIKKWEEGTLNKVHNPNEDDEPF